MKATKSILLLAMVVLLTACGDIVSTSTPENDAAKIIRMMKAAQSPREMDEARQLCERYLQAYQEEVYNGKRNVMDIKRLAIKVGQMDVNAE